MDKSEKTEMVSQIKDQFSNSSAFYLVDYQGVNVEEINGLRREFIKEDVNYKVFKNTLVKKALEEAAKPKEEEASDTQPEEADKKPSEEDS